MAPIIRNGNTPTTARFSLNLNVVLTGSKRMTPAEQERLMPVQSVRVLIVDADDPHNILLDRNTFATEFSTGSVGYSLNARDLAFQTA